MKWILELIFITFLGVTGYFAGQLDLEIIILISIIAGIIYLIYSLLVDRSFNENPLPFKQAYIHFVSAFILVMYIAKFLFFIFQEL